MLSALGLRTTDGQFCICDYLAHPANPLVFLFSNSCNITQPDPPLSEFLLCITSATMSSTGFGKARLRPESKHGSGRSERQGETQRPSASEVLLELFNLLEQYAPSWYKEEHHNRAVAALDLPSKSTEPGKSANRKRGG